MKLLALLPLSLLLTAPAAMAQCTIGAPGTAQADFQDGWSGLLPLGFSLPFNGGTYTDFFYSDHGLVALSNGGVPPAPPGNNQVYDPGVQPNTIGTLGGFPVNGGGLAGFGADVICAYWGDHVTSSPNAGAIFVDNTSGSYCTITWQSNVPFGGAASDAFTAQVTIHADGRVVVCLDGRCSNTSSAFDPVTTVIGISINGAMIPSSSDLSAGPVVALSTVYQQFDGPGPFGSNTPDPNFDLANMQIDFLPTSPGWLVTTSPLACATKSIYGMGCTGLALDSNPPVIGTNWDLTTTGLSAISPIAITFFGAASFPNGVPLPAIFINSPGCFAYVDGLVGNLSAPNVGGTALLSIALPNQATLKGTKLYATSVGLTLAVPSLIATSNGLDVTVGY